MLKNKSETKQILNEWRKVLNEGLYDQDPEILEEIFSKASRAKIKNLAAAGLMLVSLNVNSAKAKVTNPTPGLANVVHLANFFKNNPNNLELDLSDLSISRLKPDVLESLIKKIQSNESYTLDKNELKLVDSLLKEHEKILKNLEDSLNYIKDHQDEFEPEDLVFLRHEVNQLRAVIEELKGASPKDIEAIKNEIPKSLGIKVD